MGRPEFADHKASLSQEVPLSASFSFPKSEVFSLIVIPFKFVNKCRPSHQKTSTKIQIWSFGGGVSLLLLLESITLISYLPFLQVPEKIFIEQ